MRALAWALLAAAAAAAFPPPPEPLRLLVVGGAAGHLEPCGCTKPMSGGLARRVTVLRSLGGRDGSLAVDVGPVLKDPGRQSEMKLETLCEAMSAVGPWALALGPGEAALGPGPLMSAQRLGGGGVTSLAAAEGDEEVAATYVATGQFLVGAEPAEGVAAPAGLRGPVAGSVARLVEEAARRGLRAVLATPRGEAGARELARQHPRLFAVLFRSDGDPPAAPLREGPVHLATPGGRGRYVVALEWEGSPDTAPGYRRVLLGPEVPDDPSAREAMLRYKARVGAERLLEAMPRMHGPKFAGNRACSSCHAQAAEVWAKSRHARALATLEPDGSDRDPDCAGCHVVGLDSAEGFRSRAETPELTDVGCESCHGPGAAHAARPLETRMPKVGAASCAPCHDLDHSPGFDFERDWPKVAH